MLKIVKDTSLDTTCTLIGQRGKSILKLIGQQPKHQTLIGQERRYADDDWATRQGSPTPISQRIDQLNTDWPIG